MRSKQHVAATVTLAISVLAAGAAARADVKPTVTSKPVPTVTVVPHPTLAPTKVLQVRMRWQNNSVAFWDNRAVQHQALWDYFPHTRSGFRVTIQGDKPR